VKNKTLHTNKTIIEKTHVLRDRLACVLQTRQRILCNDGYTQSEKALNKAYSKTGILHSLQLCTLCYWDICIMQ